MRKFFQGLIGLIMIAIGILALSLDILPGNTDFFIVFPISIIYLGFTIGGSVVILKTFDRKGEKT